MTDTTPPDLTQWTTEDGTGLYNVCPTNWSYWNGRCWQTEHVAVRFTVPHICRPPQVVVDAGFRDPIGTEVRVVLVDDDQALIAWKDTSTRRNRWIDIEIVRDWTPCTPPFGGK